MLFENVISVSLGFEHFEDFGKYMYRTFLYFEFDILKSIHLKMKFENLKLGNLEN